jgi:hypothetical protein
MCIASLAIVYMCIANEGEEGDSEEESAGTDTLTAASCCGY